MLRSRPFLGRRTAGGGSGRVTPGGGAPDGAWLLLDVADLSSGRIDTWPNMGTDPRGGDLTAAGAARPYYQPTDGPGNGPRVWFDGANFMDGATFTEEAQPGIVAAVFRNNNLGYLGTPLSAPGVREWLIQTATVSGLPRVASLGGSLNASAGVTALQWTYIVGTLNGASSEVRMYNQTTTTGNAGFGGVEGFRIGRDVASNYLRGGMAWVGVWPTSATDADTVENYIKARFPNFA